MREQRAEERDAAEACEDGARGRDHPRERREELQRKEGLGSAMEAGGGPSATTPHGAGSEEANEAGGTFGNLANKFNAGVLGGARPGRAGQDDVGGLPHLPATVAQRGFKRPGNGVKKGSGANPTKTNPGPARTLAVDMIFNDLRSAEKLRKANKKRASCMAPLRGDGH